MAVALAGAHLSEANPVNAVYATAGADTITGSVQANTTWPGSLTTGDVAIVQFAMSDTVANCAFTVDGWTALVTPAEGNFQSVRTLAVYYCLYVPATIQPWASMATAGRASCTLLRYSGVNPTTPIDVAPTVTTSNDALSLDAPSLTTATAGAQLVSGCVSDSANPATNTITKPVTMTLRKDSTGTGRRSAMADEAFGAAGATGTRTWTQTTAALGMAVWLGALRPATGGGTITVPLGIAW